MPTLITDEVVEYCIELLCLRHHKSTIKKAVVKKFGPMTARTIETAISRARARMQANSARPVEELTAEAIAYYESIIRGATAKNPEATIMEKVAADRIRILAQAALDRLLGLGQPNKLIHVVAPAEKPEQPANAPIDYGVLADNLRSHFGRDRGVPANGGAKPVHPGPANAATGDVPGEHH